MASDADEFVIDYWVTGACDMECPFCYGARRPVSKTIRRKDGKKKEIREYVPSEETIALTNSTAARPEMRLEQAKYVLEKLHRVGARTISIGGGEPLVRTDISEIIHFARSLGALVYLSTNGTYLMRRYSDFETAIDVLGLPLDGPTVEVNARMGRRSYLLANVEEILRYFKCHPPIHLVRVGTVLSKVNAQDMMAIGNFLFRNSAIRAPDVWRIYQFERIGRGRSNQELYKISDAEFNDICRSLIAAFPQANIRPRSNAAHKDAYFFVTPDGVLQIVDETHHISIADLLTVDQNHLVNLLSLHSHTSIKANLNRDWLDDHIRYLR